MQQISFCPSQLLALPARSTVDRSDQIMTQQLSPAAQALMEAYCTEADRLDRAVTEAEMVAAALRAAALCCKRDRLILLSLADELESHGQA